LKIYIDFLLTILIIILCNMIAIALYEKLKIKIQKIKQKRKFNKFNESIKNQKNEF